MAWCQGGSLPLQCVFQVLVRAQWGVCEVTASGRSTRGRVAIRRGLSALCRLRAVVARVSGVGALHNRLPLRMRSLRSRVTNLRAHLRGCRSRVGSFRGTIMRRGRGVARSANLVRGCGTRLSGIHGGHRFSGLSGRVRFRKLRVRFSRGGVHRFNRTVGHGGRRVTRLSRELRNHGTSLIRGRNRLRRVVSRAGRSRRGLHRGTGGLRTGVRPHLLATFGHVHGKTHGNLTIMCMRHNTYNNYFGGVPPRGRLSVGLHGGIVIYRCYNHVVVSPRLTNVRRWSSTQHYPYVCERVSITCKGPSNSNQYG